MSKDPAQAAYAERIDSLFNALSGLGTDRDKGWSGNVQVGGVRAFSVTELESLYLGDSMMARIVDDLPNDATRRGWKVLVDDPEEGISEPLEEETARLSVQAAVNWAAKLARLYGGAGIVIGADDGEPMSDVLDLSKIKVVKWLLVVDRWELAPARWVLQEGEAWPGYELGLPVTYTLTPQFSGGTAQELPSEVHASRVLRFEGVPVPRRLRPRFEWWGAPLAVRIWDALSRFNMVEAGTANVVQEFNLALMKIAGLRDMVAGPDGLDLLTKRLAAVNLSKSMVNMVALDAEGESYELITRQVTGLPEIHDRSAQSLAAAAAMPLTRLMGQSPAGLSTDDKSGRSNWEDQVSAYQTTDFGPQLETLYTILGAASEGPVGDPELDFRLEFVPLTQPTESEAVKIRDAQSKVDKAYKDMGALAPDEIRESRFGGPVFSTETQLLEEFEPTPEEEKTMAPPPPAQPPEVDELAPDELEADEDELDEDELEPGE